MSPRPASRTASDDVGGRFPSWRSAYAVITDQGRAKLRRAAPVYLAAIRREFVAALDSHQVEVVEAAMSAVVDHPAQERSDG
ncbi:MAG TPA: hypothetical protein VK988_05270 [Acidimicrobiales bacterium]|nr:hypothetical protein [Acidimicrobiales bacterium]